MNIYHREIVSGRGLLHSEQDQWAREQVKLMKSSDPLWKHLGLILAQLDGLRAGAAQWAKIKHIEVCDCVVEMGRVVPLSFHSSCHLFSFLPSLYQRLPSSF